MVTTGFPLLTIIILLPVAGALLCAVLPASSEDRWAKPVGLAVALIELGFVVYLVADFKVGQAAAFQFVSQHSWIGEFGISWQVGGDGISLFLVGLTAL